MKLDNIFIEVSGPSQVSGWSCLCVLGVSIWHLSTFLFDFGTVTVWYFLFFILFVNAVYYYLFFRYIEGRPKSALSRAVVYAKRMYVFEGRKYVRATCVRITL